MVIKEVRKIHILTHQLESLVVSVLFVEGRIDNLEKELKARGYDVVEIAGAHLKGLVHPDEIQTMQRNQIKGLQAKIEDLEKELLGLRSYCTLTFGESHPEIKKCVHEVELEQLKNKEKRDG